MVQALEGEDLRSILAASGPTGIDAWVRLRLARHPQKEAITLKRAFEVLKRDYPAEAIPYGERLLLKGPTSFVLTRLSATYVMIGNLVRARELAENVERPTPDWMARTARLTSRLHLLKRGYPLPEPAAKPPYSPVPRRVMYVLHNSQPHGSAGYAIRSQGLAKAIRKLGYDLYCVTRLGYPWDTASFDPNTRVDIVEHVDGVPYIRLPSVLLGYRTIPLEDYFKFCADRLCALAEILKPSVIHAASNFICGTAANLAARRLGLPCIYEVRGLWEVTMISRRPELKETEHHRMYERMETETACNASAVLAITGPLKAELVRRGVPENKITLLPNGVDFNQWQPSARDRDLEKSLGLTGKVVIGYIGSTGTYEGLDLLLHAAVRLRQRAYNRFAILIVGDGDALTELKELAAELQLSDIVLFTGRVPHAEVDRYYSLVDIAPYPRKGLLVCEMVSPLKPFEAMAMGKAVICSDVAVLTEMVSHEKTGLLHRKDDIESLTNTLQRLLDSSELRARLGSQARMWVRANRDWNALAAVAGETYDALWKQGSLRTMRRARTFTDFIHAQVEKSDPHSIDIDKLQSREIAKGAGVATPQLYAIYKKPRDVDLASLPERFVLKPSNCHSKRGVHLLQRSDRGFYELLSRSNLTADAVIAGLEEFTRAEVIAEELIPGPKGPLSIPFDYKFYTFGDSVLLIQQVDRNHDVTMLNFFDGSFGELPSSLVLSKWETYRPGTPVIPENASDMIVAARSVSRYLNRPFIRVDLYTDGPRVWLGETTPTPGYVYYGRFYLSPEFNLALGEHWSKGCERLGWEIPMLRTEPRRYPRSTGPLPVNHEESQTVQQ